MELAFWLPLILIFASALLAAVVKRYSKDPCLKVFHKSFVFVRMKDGRWISGHCSIYPNCLELRYQTPEPLGPYEMLTYVLYEPNLESIDRVLRPSPQPESSERTEWDLEIHRLRHPSFLRRAKRRIRILFNILRDAFTQAFSVLFGVVKRRTRLSAIPVDEGKVGEMGRTLIGAVPNAYEPILEKYLGRQIIVETPRGDTIVQQSGVLQEYSAKYILVRDVDLLPEGPPKVCDSLSDHQFDVAFPRSINWVRHLARSLAQ